MTKSKIIGIVQQSSLSEFDKMMEEIEDAGIESQDCKEYESMEENIKSEKLNEILAKYF
ncbi:MAG TPA: hypothetical protein VN704_06815 [Verrucomicrobiae bacterium]|nr:hypothetical protein [Verrucomicrobiae bacterium]